MKVHRDLEGTSHTARLLPTWAARVSEQGGSPEPAWCQQAELTCFLACCQARHSPASIAIPLHIGILSVHGRPLLF